MSGAFRPKLVAVTVCTTAALWTVLCVYVVHANLPFNAVHLPFEHRLDVQAWAPEGWAFFTKSPRDDRLFLYRRIGGRWLNISLGPDSRASNLFGLSRRARAQGVEAGLMQVNLSSTIKWTDCATQSVDSCLEAGSPAATVRNLSPQPTLCGEVAFVHQPPVPWAWLSLRKPVQMPARILILRSRC